MNASSWTLRLRRASSAISLIALAMIPALPLRGQDAPDTTKHTVQQSLHSPPPRPPIIAAISYGAEKYTKIPVPVLAIFAVPRNWDRVDPAARAARVAADLAYTSAQANAFEAGVPTARVVRLPNADHDVFISNEADVLREMNDFLTKVSN